MRVFTNTAVSVDGKIATHANDHVEIASPEDRRRMHLHRARADAVLVGGATFRAWALPLIEDPAIAKAEARRPMLNVVLTRSGITEALRSRDSVWPHSDVRLLVLGPPELTAQEHPDWVEVVTAVDPSPAWAVDIIQARGCESLLVEGGGDLIFQLLDAGKVDEMYVTLAHRIVGGRASKTLADGRGFDPARIQDLTLLDLERASGELFLHYAVDS